MDNLLATVTYTGRAAIALAISRNPLYVAWGTGLPEWDEMKDEDLPSVVDWKNLQTEIGYRIASTVGFVEPDDQGGLVVPVGRKSDDTIEEARYRQVLEATPYLYIRVNYDFGDASNSVIREAGIYMDTKVKEGLPQGQMYFTPAEIESPGMLLCAQIMRPVITRSPAQRQSLDFVLPI